MVVIMSANNKILKAINNIHKKVAECGVNKNGLAEIKNKTTNATFTFNYQKLEDIYAVISPMMAEEGIICIPSVVSEVETIEQYKVRSKVTVDYTFSHLDDGSSITVRSIGEDSDNGGRSTVKAMSAAHKTALKQMFLIPVVGEDSTNNSKPKNGYGYKKQSNNHAPEPEPQQDRPKFITTGQMNWLLKQINELGMDLNLMLNHYKIESFLDITKEHYEHLRQILVKRKEELNHA